MYTQSCSLRLFWHIGWNWKRSRLIIRLRSSSSVFGLVHKNPSYHRKIQFSGNLHRLHIIITIRVHIKNSPLSVLRATHPFHYADEAVHQQRLLQRPAVCRRSHQQARRPSLLPTRNLLVRINCNNVAIVVLQFFGTNSTQIGITIVMFHSRSAQFVLFVFVFIKTVVFIIID